MKRIQRRVTTRAMFAVVLVVGLLGLTACNDGGGNGGDSLPGGESPLVSASSSASVAQASSSPTTDLSTEPMPEPTSTVYAAATPERAAQNVPVPVMPEEAKLQTDEGWVAFAKYYIEELNYMVETNDYTRVQKITTSGCEYCNQETAIANFRREYSQWLTGGEYSLEYIFDQRGPTETGAISGILTMSVAESVQHGKNGSLPPTPAIESSNWSMALYWYEGAWVVDRLREIEK